MLAHQHVNRLDRGRLGQCIGGELGEADRRVAADVALTLGFTRERVENDEIAERLGSSPRTVERRLGNIYAKLGVEGKSARAAAAAWFSRSHTSR